jgi:hypothetical protein
VRLVSYLEREEPWERYRDPIVEIRTPGHRPRKRFVVRIRSAQDALRARDMGVPLLLVQSEDLKMLRYPLRIPPTVLVPRELREVLDSALPVHVFQSTTPFSRPRIEDIVVFLLMHDPIAALAVVERNEDLLDLGYVRKRIIQEDLEREATRVRMQRYVDVPEEGEPLPEAALIRAARANRVVEVVP